MTPEHLERAALDQAVKAWRGDHLSRADAARLLGLSKRTLEYIEHGRGFRYPKMLLLAMQAIQTEARK